MPTVNYCSAHLCFIVIESDLAVLKSDAVVTWIIRWGPLNYLASLNENMSVIYLQEIIFDVSIFVYSLFSSTFTTTD
jgi:hypothetical protein